MFERLSIFAVLWLVSASDLFAEAHHKAARVGDLLVVNMTGDVAKEYAMRTGMPKQEKPGRWKDINFNDSNRLAQYRADGKYRIECSSTVANKENPPRMLMLTAIVDPKQFKSETTPKNTPVYASPADEKEW